MNQTDEAARIAEASAFLHTRLTLPAAHPVGIVLGSGLGAFADQLASPIAIDYTQIPHFPQPGVPGHAGRLLAGTIDNRPVLVLQGRVHAYEGHSAAAIVFGVRVLAALGVRILVLTNAAGTIRPRLRPGQLAAISDHINLSGLNPAAGPPLGDLPRFFDMAKAYAPRLRALARQAAASAGIKLPEAVYIAVPGPSFETPAEIRAFRALGADLVGMSTALETIAARQAGVEVLGISCVTNLAAGLAPAPLTHHEVLETGRAIQGRLADLLTRFVALAAPAA